MRIDKPHIENFINGGRLVECADNLPNIPDNIDNLYLDFETTSGDSKIASVNPWHNCKVYGVAFTYDTESQSVPGAWYLPDTLGKDVIIGFVGTLLSRCKRWINHNVKYDAHVARNDLGLTIPEDLELVDTLTLSKIIDSDRQFLKENGGYAIEALSQAWLNQNISPYKESLEAYLYQNKDYGEIPHDILGEYACQDVITVRDLWKYINSQCPEECRRVWNTEIELTSVLFRIEQRGLHVDPTELKIEHYKSLKRMIEIEQYLWELTGQAFRPHTNADCFDVLCNQYGLPVMGWTEGNQPSFDKAAMLLYSIYPVSPDTPEVEEIISLIQEYRTLGTFVSFFLVPYTKLQIDGILHSDYNQCVRTGRMSAKRPNAQQLNPLAKSLVHPKPGYTFISTDASQIEFRTIVHYIQDEELIAAYNENADIDFHQWVADMCEMPRKPAKNVNFATAFGQGKKSLVSQLAGDKTIVGNLKEKSTSDAHFKKLAVAKAESVYSEYHERLPGIKRTAKQAERVARVRGYVKSIRGRRRHIPLQRAHIAFNTLNQASAADIVKERMVALDKMLQNFDAHIVAQVHDEILIEIREDLDIVGTEREIVKVLETMPDDVDLRVPLRWNIGHCPSEDKSWRAACDDDVQSTVQY